MKYDTYEITDELLEFLGFKKIEADYNNYDKVLCHDFKKYKLLTTDKIKINQISFSKRSIYFELGHGRYLQKLDNGYLLVIYEVSNEFIPHTNDVYHDESIFLTGPFWVTVIYNIKLLKELLDVLHIKYSKYKIGKYLKDKKRE